MDQETKNNITQWLEGSYDDASKEEVRNLQGDALVDAFYRKLEFGTGGLRGIMGVGTNRLNIYTVRTATQGLANYLKKECPGEITVLVGFDSRKHSELFAQETARVLAGNGIRPLLLDGLRPVPLVSFGCRHLGCNAAVLITASHNPPEYNGYKVYWSNGGQVLPPHDKGIIAEVDAIDSLSQIELGELPEERVNVDAAYLDVTTPLASHPDQNHQHGSELKLIYSSLHGTGITLAPKLLQRWGFSDVHLVEKQCIPDATFPTVNYPNPEEPSALEMGTAQLMKEEGDLFIATDPDADRLGVVIRHQGQAIPLNGNETACLCLHHLCKAHKEPGLAAIKTIVTSELFAAIADHYGIRCYDCLTGFKYIGELMDQMSETYLFGAEESYGCLIGTHARDKDAISATTLVCEMALDAKLAGETLIDRLQAIYTQYGVYRELLDSLTFKGKEGADKMRSLMDALRKEPPKNFCGVDVDIVEDYLTSTRYLVKEKQQEPLTLPKSNVLLWRLADQTKLVIRPSGTEPKIKVYVGVVDSTIEASDSRLKSYLSEIKTNV